MPTSNRGDFPKTGLIIGAVICALIAAAFIGWGISKSAEYKREANYRANQYAAYTDNQIRQSCLRPTVQNKANCIAEARHKQRENERQEQDLVAQRQSALWAYVMGSAAVIGMGLSAVGIFLVWTTFRETKESNFIARAEALRNAAEADRARRHIIATERAVLTIRYMSAEPVSEGDAFIKLRLHMRNDGRSNAWDIQVAKSTRSSRVYPSRFELSPPLPIIALAGKEVTTSPIMMRKPKNFPVFVTGYVSYTTAHDAVFRTFFIYRFDGLPVVDSHGGHAFQPVDASDGVELPSNT